MFKFRTDFEKSKSVKKVIEGVCIWSLAIALSACESGQQTDPIQPDANTQKTQNKEEESSYTRTEIKTSWGILEKYELKPGALDQKVKKSNQSSPVKIAINSAPDRQVFLVDEKRGNVVLIPKLVLNENLLEARKKAQSGKDGTVRLNTSLILADGLTSVMGTSLKRYALPQKVLLPNADAFDQELSEALHKKPRYLSKITCPQDISFYSERFGEVRAQIAAPFKACPMNSFIPVQMTFSQEDWEKLGVALENEDSWVVRYISTIGKTFPLEWIRLAVDKEEIRKKIEADIPESEKSISEEKVHQIIEQTIGAMKGSFSLSYPEFYFENLKNEIVREFFIMSSNDVHVFVAKEALHEKQRGMFQVQIQLEEFLGSQMSVTEYTPLISLFDTQAPLLIQSSLRDSLGNITDIPVRSPILAFAEKGDILEIQLNQVRWKKFEPQPTVPELVHHSFCKKPFDLCEDGEWVCLWLVVGLPPARPVSIYCRADFKGKYPFGPNYDVYPWPDLPQLPYRIGSQDPKDPRCGLYPAEQLFRWDCKKVKTNQCEPWDLVDHWEKQIYFGIPTLEKTWREKPSEGADGWIGWINGLELEVLASDGISKTCPLKDLKFQINKKKLSIQLQSTEKCPLFERNSGNVSIINRIQVPSEYPCGALIEHWDGKRTYQCNRPTGETETLESSIQEDNRLEKLGKKPGLWQSYYPPIELDTTVRIIKNSQEF